MEEHICNLVKDLNGGVHCKDCIVRITCNDVCDMQLSYGHFFECNNHPKNNTRV